MKNFAKNFTDKWWLLVLQGILAIAFGVVAWVWPGLTVLTLVILFGAYAFAGGVMSLFAARGARREGDSPWPFIFQGLLGIATGILVAVWPDISALSLLFVIAGFAIANGIFEVVSAIELRKTITNEWLLALTGLASIGFGLFTAIYPGDGAVALVWTIGVYAVVVGTLLIALGFRLHGWGRQLTSATAS